MPKYNVGDVASLFPSPSTEESGNNLQSLFNKHYSKNRNLNFSKKHNKKENIKQAIENKDTENLRKTSEKRKGISYNDSFIDNQPQAKNLTSKKVATETKFIRSNKKQRKNTQSENQFVSSNDSEVENEQDRFKVDSSRSFKKTNGGLPKVFNKKQKFLPSVLEIQRSAVEKETFQDHQNFEIDCSPSPKTTNEGLMKKSKKEKTQISTTQSQSTDNKEEIFQKFKVDSSLSFKIDNNGLSKKNKKKRKGKVAATQKQTSNEEKTFQCFQNMKVDSPLSHKTTNVGLSKKFKTKHEVQTPATLSQSSDEEEETFQPFQNKESTVKHSAPENKKDLPCTIFIGNLPMSATKKIILKMFQPFGPLKTIRFRGAIASKSGIPKKVAEIKNKYHEGVQCLKAFIVFKDEESAKNALILNGTLMDKHHILVDFATEVGGKKVYDNHSTIFVGNLPFNVSDETVWSAFEVCGEIQAVRIIRDRATGAGKGFGYVQFTSASSKKQALELEDLEIDKRKIRVKAVESNTQNKSSKETVKIIRSNVAMKRSKESGNKKSVKKLLRKGKRLHKYKQIAQILARK